MIKETLLYTQDKRIHRNLMNVFNPISGGAEFRTNDAIKEIPIHADNALLKQISQTQYITVINTSLVSIHVKLNNWGAAYQPSRLYSPPDVAR